MFELWLERRRRPILGQKQARNGPVFMKRWSILVPIDIFSGFLLFYARVALYAVRKLALSPVIDVWSAAPHNTGALAQTLSSLGRLRPSPDDPLAFSGLRQAYRVPGDSARPFLLQVEGTMCYQSITHTH